MIESLVLWFLCVVAAASSVFFVFEQKRASAEHNVRYRVGTRSHYKHKPDMAGGLAMVCAVVAIIFGGLGYATWP